LFPKQHKNDPDIEKNTQFSGETSQNTR